MTVGKNPRRYSKYGVGIHLRNYLNLNPTAILQYAILSCIKVFQCSFVDTKTIETLLAK